MEQILGTPPFALALNRRANGDTFHKTHCSPQVDDFNRAVFGFNGLWGELEKNVLKYAKNEKLCAFSGPVLRTTDREFSGKDQSGDVAGQPHAKSLA